MSDSFIDWTEVNSTLEDLDLADMMDLDNMINLDSCAAFQSAEWPVNFALGLTGTPSAV